MAYGAALEIDGSHALARLGAFAAALVRDAPWSDDPGPAPAAPLLVSLERLANGADAAAHDALMAAAEGLPGPVPADAVEARKLLQGLSPEAARDLVRPVLLWFTETPGAAAALAGLSDAFPDAPLPAYLAAAIGAGELSRDRRLALTERALEAGDLLGAGLLHGDLLLAAGRIAAAREAYETVAFHPAAPAETRLSLGALAEQAGDDVLAERAYRGFLDVAPDNPAGLNQLAWFLAQRGRDLDEAQGLAEAALSQAPGNAAILDTLGWIAHLRGDPETAISRLTAAVDAARGTAPAIALNLAEAQIAAGRPAAAARILAPLLPNLTGTPLEDRARTLADAAEAG